MRRSLVALALLIIAISLSESSTRTLTNGGAASVERAGFPTIATDDWQMSAQRRTVATGRQGSGRVGTGRVGTGRVGTGRVGTGRVGRVGQVGRIGRVGRVGRVGYVGRVGILPPPVPVAPGPGLIRPAVPATCPVCPRDVCALAHYSEQNLTGRALETGDNQPRLDAIGWQNEISSLLVKSGTWDFYSELEYKGQAIRLAPGSYPVLEPQWTKRIGSYMCVRLP